MIFRYNQHKSTRFFSLLFQVFIIANRKQCGRWIQTWKRSIICFIKLLWVFFSIRPATLHCTVWTLWPCATAVYHCPLSVSHRFWPDLSFSLARRFPSSYNVQECVALSVSGHGARARIKGHGFSRQTYTFELSAGKFVRCSGILLTPCCYVQPSFRGYFCWVWNRWNL